jgi:hypothetical protein
LSAKSFKEIARFAAEFHGSSPPSIDTENLWGPALPRFRMFTGGDSSKLVRRAAGPARSKVAAT